MSRAKTDALAHVVNANDKLLKALITLIALKDEQLLEDLKAVLALAGREGNEIGRADAPTWAHLRKELALISSLVEGGDEEDADEEDDEDVPPRRAGRML